MLITAKATNSAKFFGERTPISDAHFALLHTHCKKSTGRFGELVPVLFWL